MDSASTSDAWWAASASSARDPTARPPTSSATSTPALPARASRSARRVLPGSAGAPPWWCVIDHDGIPPHRNGRSGWAPQPVSPPTCYAGAVPTVFTRIIDGEIPGAFVWRDPECVGFLSIDPVQPGHTLIVPRGEIDHWVDPAPAP